MRRWDFDLRAYYGRQHRTPGVLAFGANLQSQCMLDIEIEASRGRVEIGRIEVMDLRPGSDRKFREVYNEAASCESAREPAAPGSDGQRMTLELKGVWREESEPL